MQYLNTLFDFCRQIKEQQASLQQIKAHFQSTSNIPLNLIHPTIKLLSEIRAFLQRMIHMHEMDTMHKIRKDLVSHHPSLAQYINITWCCRCHNLSCIYDESIFLACNSFFPLLTTQQPFFFDSHTFFSFHYYPSVVRTTLSITCDFLE